MTTRHTRWTVYGCRHPAFDSIELGRYRWYFTAKLAAWWFRVWDVGPDANAWIREDVRISWTP